MEEVESCVPPGFRFHPTEEELVGYYLKRKIRSLKIDLDVIVELDLYKMEPWDMQERCNLGYNEQNEWYFFSHKDKKYPTGTRTNRATAAGFWKATGRDKAVLSNNKLIGMRKTLVFYKGRAPNGRKSDWIMHEYRLQTSDHAPPQEEGWVVCRAFKKPTPSHRQGFEAWNHNACYGNNNINTHISMHGQSFSDMISSPSTTSTGMYMNQSSMSHQEQSQLIMIPNINNNQSPMFLENQIIELPQLDSPTMSTREDQRSNNDQYVDWKNLDSFLSSQTSLNPHDQDLASLTLPHEFDHLHPQNNANYLLGCFPDS